MAETMRAMEATSKGVEMVEIPKPTPGSGEVRVKVIATSVNPAEEKIINGDFVSRFLHARTSPLIMGWDFAGTIDAIGDSITDIDKGSAVWGHLPFSMTAKQGTYAEYVTVRRADLALKPDNVPYHIAAAAATVSMTGLQSMRDEGRLSEGNRVLIIGAGGGIGACAVGIAKRLGAHVTGVCSTKDVQRIKSLGADEVIDRKTSDPLQSEAGYDVVFDTPAVYSFGSCLKILRPGATYVTTLPDGALISGMVHAIFNSRRCRFVQVSSRRADLELVGNWLSQGLEIPIDSRHKIADLGAALKRQTEPSRVGRVVVDVAECWPS